MQYRVAVLLGAAALILAISNAVMFSNNQQAQNEVSARAQYIQQSVQLEPLYQSMIKSLAELAAKENDRQVRELLASQGITFTANPQPAPAK